MRNSWPTKKLGDICEIRGGGTPSKAVERYWRGDIPWVSPKDMKAEIVSDSIDHISHEAVANSATSLIPKNAVLMVVRSGILARIVPIAITGRDVTVNQDLKALCPRGTVEARFLYHLLGSKMGELLSLVSRGATVHRLMTEHIRALECVVPPLDEQRRIVRILDEAFEGLATAKANAEKNFRNSRALFDSYLQAVLTRRGNGWLDKRLGQCCHIARGGSPRPIKKYLTTSADGINWIKIGDATASGKYIFKTEEKIIPKGAHRSRSVRDGDFLLSNSMSFGRPYIMRTAGCIHDGWLVLTDYQQQLDQNYLYHVLGSPAVFQQFDRLAAGSTVRNLNIELASRVVIPVPPLESQRTIAAEVEAFEVETERIKSVYERKVLAMDALHQSLLHHAFTAQL